MFIKNLEDSMTTAIVCNQWGDTGKGKFVDLLGERSDIIIRGTGGANAGHTIKLNGDTYVFHLLPSGILHDSQGKINIIGSGVAFDANIVKEELDILKGYGKSFDNLMVAYNSKLVLPHHLLLDNLISKKKIGTTGKGIGPVYEDYIGRRRLIVNDILNPSTFHKKLSEVLGHARRFVTSFESDVVHDVMNSKPLKEGRYFSNSDKVFDIDAIVEDYVAFGREFKDMIRDTDTFARDRLGRKKILLEGAQGLLLSSDYGASPFITCSDSSINGLVKGSGLNRPDVDLVLGIAKFYLTRVGEGPFPSELGGLVSDEWCNHLANRELEEESYAFADINDVDDFKRGVAIRRVGDEYGATTKRPRRTGWLDLPLLKYAMNVNGPNLIITKPDVLTGMDDIKIAFAYMYEGDDYAFGGSVLKEGDILTNHIPLSEVMSKCRPLYDVFPGWTEDISKISNYDDLPSNFKNILNHIESETGGKINIVSVGPDRYQTIFK
ncbi:MAG: adenylosuccinate synthetase [Candidatus Woesearchaeota archaeon]